MTTKKSNKRAAKKSTKANKASKATTATKAAVKAEVVPPTPYTKLSRKEFSQLWKTDLEKLIGQAAMNRTQLVDAMVDTYPERLTPVTVGTCVSDAQNQKYFASHAKMSQQASTDRSTKIVFFGETLEAAQAAQA